MIIDDLYKVTMLSAGWLIIFEYLNPVEAIVYAIAIIVIIGYILITNYMNLFKDSENLLGDWR